MCAQMYMCTHRSAGYLACWQWCQKAIYVGKYVVHMSRFSLTLARIITHLNDNKNNKKIIKFLKETIKLLFFKCYGS